MHVEQKFQAHTALNIAIPTHLQTRKFPSLDGLRAVSISLVLIAHISDTFNPSQSLRVLFTQIGLLGVQVFFVISGFLITTLLLKEKINTGNISLRNFYFRRALRILPVAILYLFFLIILNNLFHLQIPLKCFLGAVFFLANLSYFQGSWYTAHYWSLSVEEQYYLFFPFLVKKLKLKVAFILIAMLALITFVKETVFLGYYLFPDKPVYNIIWMLIYQSDGVLVGSLLSIVWFKNSLPVNFIRKYSIIFSALLPFLVFLFAMNILVFHSFNSLIVSILIALFIANSIINTESLTFMFLNNKIVSAIGILSYSIYIWQQLFTSTNGRLGAITRLPLNIVLIAGVSYCSYYFFEARFLKLKEKFKNL